MSEVANRRGYEVEVEITMATQCGIYELSDLKMSRGLDVRKVSYTLRAGLVGVRPGRWYGHSRGPAVWC